ncbi:PGF-CTERM sorting domain-containing protein [Halospeciosus flavus]|uniref:PGF-CTERM sorting domain-containing protein n=1 Tax=Halospeciosus flavus TaxID=3032283 RepID=UPI00361193AA
MNQHSSRLLAALLALTVFGGAFAGVAAAASAGSITAQPAEPGATSTHTVTEMAGSTIGGSFWTGYQVDYQGTGADVSNVNQSDVVKIGIDRNDDEAGSTIDVNVEDDLQDVKSSNNGKTLTFSLGGSYALNQSDEVVVVYEDVQNPSEAGEYNVTLDINHQSSGSQVTATLAIGQASDTTTTTTTTSEDTTTTTTESEETTTESEQTTTTAAEETTTTEGGSPGFGVAVALVALVGAALVAVRKA